jgi:hypothetical protein
MPPSVLTEELVARLVPHLEAGGFLRPACEREGIAYATVTTPGGEEGAALVQKLARARAVGEALLLARARQVRDDGGDWKLETWQLERLRPTIYRETTRTELTGADGGPVAVSQVAAEADAIMERLAAGTKRLPP